MDFLLYDPGYPVIFLVGLVVGGVIAGGLIHLGAVNEARRLSAEAERINASRQAAESARHWGAAANDAPVHYPATAATAASVARSQMRGPR